MADMKKVRVPTGTQFYTEEGDLVEVNGGIFPQTFLVMELEPGQPWVLNRVFFGCFGPEDGTTSGAEFAEDVIEKIRKKGVVNLVDHWIAGR